MAKIERGRPLTRKIVLETALQLMDQEGPEGFNMRKLGATLGVEAMSLYNHIKNKEDLLDGVIEMLLLQTSYPQRPGVTPYTEIWDFAHAYRDVLRTHPRVLSLVATRQLRTEPSLAILERLVATLHRANVRGVHALYAVNSLAGFIIGHAFFDVASIAVPTISQEGDVAEVWGRLSANRYPTLHAAIPAFKQWDADQEFDFGLQALLQGILPPDE
ncbi:MAG: TetR/AcrR family transcriptional regulator C-terminal domain-containing protein [Ktedonobacteraceae bacterium]|nr:TetR/AcrR family transcriptional regulator C-terminal domain-containing protein [Ktedonobacteraceae bacterium]MBO0792199.1 TetR/AcrR family transcriptional regulator C-terminal domain-containing protein [Ktedonobacteraceae bacterium]